METDQTTKIRLWPGDRASIIEADTDLARALEYPSGHPVWAIWRSAEQVTEFFDATLAVVAGTGTQDAVPDNPGISTQEGIRLLGSGSLVGIQLVS